MELSREENKGQFCTSFISSLSGNMSEEKNICVSFATFIGKTLLKSVG